MKNVYGVYTVLVTKNDEKKLLKGIKSVKREVKSVERTRWHKATLFPLKLRYYVLCCTEEAFQKITEAVSGTRVY